MKTTCECVARLSLATPRPREGYEKLEAATVAFEELSGVEILPAYESCGPMTLHICRGARIPVNDPERSVTQLEVTGTIEIDEDEEEAREVWAEVNLPWTEDSLRQVATPMAEERLSQALGALALCGQIARPGAFHFTVARRSQDVSWLPGTVSIPRGSLGGAIEAVERLNWPRLHAITMSDVVRWAHRVAGWNRCVGEGGTGRALGALSRIIESNDRRAPSTLPWALGGLEALYGIDGDVDDRSARAAQLAERMKVLIGRPADSRYLRDVYEYRARMVHGGVDLPFTFRGEPLDCENEEPDRALIATEGVATAMLLASVQELIVRGWSEVEWGQRVQGHRTTK